MNCPIALKSGVPFQPMVCNIAGFMPKPSSFDIMLVGPVNGAIPGSDDWPSASEESTLPWFAPAASVMISTSSSWEVSVIWL
jgi:hypothetical protein